MNDFLETVGFLTLIIGGAWLANKLYKEYVETRERILNERLRRWNEKNGVQDSSPQDDTKPPR